MKLPGNIRLKDVDKGFNRVRNLWTAKKQWGDTKGARIELGYSDAMGAEVARYAMYHEHGTPTIPARPAIGGIIPANEAKYKQALHGILVAQLARVKAGQEQNVVGSLDQLGRQVVADVRARIKGHIPPRLADDTLAAKARMHFPSTPLIRTGKLLKSVAHQVTGGNGGGHG